MILSASDCFELGNVPWFREALNKELQERRKSVSRQEVMEYFTVNKGFRFGGFETSQYGN